MRHNLLLFCFALHAKENKAFSAVIKIDSKAATFAGDMLGKAVEVKGKNIGMLVCKKKNSRKNKLGI